MGSANPARVAACRALGAEVVTAPDGRTAFEMVEAIARDEGRSFIHPFEGPYTALGTATLGVEWLEQVPDLDAVIIAIGGGGLCGGASAAIKLLKPDCLVFGVEPTGSDTMTRSFAQGQPIDHAEVRTIADSLAPPFALPYSYGLCRANVDDHRPGRRRPDPLRHGLAVPRDEARRRARRCRRDGRPGRAVAGSGWRARRSAFWSAARTSISTASSGTSGRPRRPRRPDPLPSYFPVKLGFRFSMKAATPSR